MNDKCKNNGILQGRMAIRPWDKKIKDIIP